MVIKVYIDINEVLRYLGVSPEKADKKLKSDVQEGIKEILSKAQPRYVYNIFDLDFECEYVHIKETNINLSGNSIRDHLRDCKKCALFAATLGVSVDKIIRYYSRFDITKSLILDACATTLIESFCDEIESKIKNIAKEKYRLNITSRYSPGYGDLSLEVQPDLLNILGSNKIGLTVNDNLIMIPRKSVTAIIGFKEKKELFNDVKCINCYKRSDCVYRRG